MQYMSYIGSFSMDVSVAQLVASMPGIVLGGVVMAVGSNFARGKIFTASIGSVDSLYPSVFIYCMNLHQFLILCSSKAMMFSSYVCFQLNTAHKILILATQCAKLAFWQEMSCMKICVEQNFTSEILCSHICENPR